MQACTACNIRPGLYQPKESSNQGRAQSAEGARLLCSCQTSTQGEITNLHCECHDIFNLTFSPCYQIVVMYLQIIGSEKDHDLVQLSW